MIFIWTGKGYLVPLTTIGVLGAFGAVVGLSAGESAWRDNGWVWAVALTASAGLTWIVGRRANKRPYQWVQDLDSGRRFKLKSRNSFCFVSIEYWAFPLLAFAIGCLVRDLLGFW